MSDQPIRPPRQADHSPEREVPFAPPVVDAPPEARAAKMLGWGCAAVLVIALLLVFGGVALWLKNAN
jgi:hypothetical protein